MSEGITSSVESPSTTTTASPRAETAGSSTALDRASQIVDAVGKEFFATIRANANQPQVELEVRLTYPRVYEERPGGFQRGRGGHKRSREDDAPPQKRTAVTPAVHKDDFSRITQYIQSTLPSATVSHSLTEDVNTREKGRMSFVIQPDGSADFMKSVQKSKLAVRDITLPEEVSPYNIRIALSKELEELEEKDKKTAAVDGPAPVLSQLEGYRRRKKRTSLKDGEFVYDLTEVTASRNTHTFEVEIEWSPETNSTASNSTATLKTMDEEEKQNASVASSSGSESGVITEHIVCDLLRRAVQLATLEGLVGMASEGSQKSAVATQSSGQENNIPNRPPPQPSTS